MSKEEKILENFKRKLGGIVNHLEDQFDSPNNLLLNENKNYDFIATKIVILRRVLKMLNRVEEEVRDNSY